MITDEQIDAAADAMIADMWAPHEIPISDELKAKYRHTARMALEAVARIPSLPFISAPIPEDPQLVRQAEMWGEPK